MLGIGLGLNKLRSSGLSNILQGAMVWGRRSLYKWGETSIDVWGLSNKIVEIVIAYVARVTAASGVVEGQACLQNKLQDLDTKLLLDNASLVLIPSGYKESVLYSEVPTSGAGDLDVVRATTATRVNSAGLIELVPRNLLQYSNILTNPVWTNTNTTITSGQVSPTQPNNEGWLINKTATGVDGYFYNSFNLNSLSVHSYSYYILKDNNETRFPEFFLRLNTGQVEQYVQINTKTGALAVRVASAGCTQSITSTADNLWWRLILTNPAPTAFTADNRHGVRPAAGTVLGVYNLNATGSVITYGAQVEEGSTATEYLPTVTRLNFPRLDYTNSSCPSLLVEPQRTNLFIRSEELDNVIWSKTNTTVTANATTSPSGILNADKLVEDTANSQHYINQSFLNSNSLFTYSIYAKKGERDFLSINAFATIPNNFTYVPTAYFDLNNGTTGTVSNCIASIVNVGNGWYRCIVQCTSVFPQTSLNVSFYNYIANTINNTTYLGNGTSGIYLWGAQIEAGAYPTSYIPTVAASVTRNADVIGKTGISSLIGQTEGTILFDGIVNNIQNATSNIINTNKTPSTLSSIALTKIKATNKIRFEQFLGNGTFVNIPLLSTNSFADGVRTKVAVRYKSGDFAMYINGVLEATSTNTFTNIGVKSEIYLNDSIAIFAFQESVSFNQVNLYTTGLSNTELAQLTTI